MKIHNLLPMLIAASAVSASSAITPADAQANYYTSPQYQAEEQAFRARQNQGAAIHETFGEQSPQFWSWKAQDNSMKGVQSNPYGYGYKYNPYYAGINTYDSYTMPLNWWY